MAEVARGFATRLQLSPWRQACGMLRRNHLWPMSTYPQLSKPPIIEAIIEMKARFPVARDRPQIDAFQRLMASDFPVANEIHRTLSTFQVRGQGDKPPSVVKSKVGVRLEDAAGQWVVQGRFDGLSMSRLQPYLSWDQLIDRYRVAWQFYCEAFQPVEVTRVGVRFINFIPLPRGETVDLDTMFTAAPRSPAGMPQLLKEFSCRVVVGLPDDAGAVTIQHNLGEVDSGPNAGVGGVLLDIDAWTTNAWSIDSPDLWAAMQTMRQAKNRAFFSAITESTLKEFR